MRAVASVVTYVTSEKKYHNDVGKALGITQPHVATENA